MQASPWVDTRVARAAEGGRDAVVIGLAQDLVRLWDRAGCGLYRFIYRWTIYGWTICG